MEAAEGVEGGAAPRGRSAFVPSLRELAQNALIRWRSALGDVGWIDVETLRTICWNCNPEQLQRIEDETLRGSDRDLSWYTWHLWRRLLASELGATSHKAPPLKSSKPVDYTPPRGLEGEPADYRRLYFKVKAELDARAAAAKERLAAAYQQAQEEKDSRKAKMIDKLQPTKRPRTAVHGGGHGQRGSTLQGAQRPRSAATMKVLKEIGLVKKPAAVSPQVVRVIRPAVPSAAVGHSSSLAGARLLERATGGQLGSVKGSGSSAAAPPPAVSPPTSSRAAAVAAAAAANAAAAASAAARRTPPPPPAGSRLLQPGGASKREAADAQAQPPSKHARVDAGGDDAGGRNDSRVLFPRKQPPPSPPGHASSKLAVPVARATPPQTAARALLQERRAALTGTGAARPGKQAAHAVGSFEPLEDL